MSLSTAVVHDAKVLWDFHTIVGEPCPAQVGAILALGSHDLRVAAHATQLMLAGVAPLLVVSGGAGKVTQGIWHEAEGDGYAEIAVRGGVPKDSVLIERESTNTTDNIINSRELLQAQGIPEPKEICLVIKPYMKRRALAVAGKQWPSVRWYADAPDLDFDSYPSDETPIDRMISLMVGDLQRLNVYATRGYQLPVVVPDDVWLAYHRLVGAGFDQFVIKD